ncbi:MAG: hypothetical protein AABY15_09015 [Nanoarchaeota archaeon]
MVYTVYTTEKFDKEVKKLSQEEQERVQKIFLQVKENPYVGDQLQIKILREKRLREKRVYYLVFEDLKVVLFVATSDKKTQQKTIDYIIKYVNEYRGYLRELLKYRN